MGNGNLLKTDGHISREMDLNGKHAVIDFPDPKECPTCHSLISAHFLFIKVDDSNKKPLKTDEQYWFVYAGFYCDRCFTPFVVEYLVAPDSDTSRSGVIRYTLKATVLGVAPFRPIKPDWPSRIETMFPEFCLIYRQASDAEYHGLSELLGPGYRKALEFLIKTYLIAIFPDDEPAISKKPLGNCIDEYIDDHRIKTLAKKSVWIGNDLTHFIQNRPDTGVEELKLLIRATVNFIESDLIFRYAQSIPKI